MQKTSNTKFKTYFLSDKLGQSYAIISAVMVVAVCLFIICTVIYYGHGVLSLSFLTSEPSASAMDAVSGGILTPMIGTLLLTILGIIISFPFSLATAIYMNFYAKDGIFKKLISGTIDILSGIPTIVIALFALSIFTQPWAAFLSSKI